MTDAEFARLSAEMWKLMAEERKFMMEERKLEHEERKLHRETMFMPISVMIAGLTAGAAIVGATILILKYMA